MVATPPRWPGWLLAIGVRGERRELILGDLIEEFHTRIAVGQSPAAARRVFIQQAIASLGAILVARLARDRHGRTPARIAGRRAAPFGHLPGDLRSTLRGWRRAPALPATIVLTLIFGLGLASAIFAFADGYLFRALPYRDSDRLFVVADAQGRLPHLRTSEIEALRSSAVGHLGFVDASRSSPVFSGQMMIDGRDVQVSPDGVGPDFAEVIGVPLVIGRPFTAADHTGAQPVPVWLTHRFWDREFARDPGVLGRAFDIRSGPRSVRIVVVGVTSPLVRTLSTSFGRSQMLPDLFAPALPRPPQAPGTGNTIALSIVRLPPAMPPAEAETAISATLQSFVPAPEGRTRRVRLTSLHAHQFAAGTPLATAFFTGAILALALVTLNLTHLLLARSAARTREIATRRALGASRWQVARLFVVESAAYGAIGIGGGLVLGRWLAAVIAAEIPTRGNDGANLAVAAMSFDIRVVAFAGVMGATVALFGSVWPAWRAIRQSAALAARTRAASVPARFSKWLLAAEVAASTVVLIGTAFVGLGIWRHVSQPVGVEFDDRFSVSFPTRPGLTEAPVDWPALLDAIRRVPGVRAAADSSARDVRGRLRIADRDLAEDEGVAVTVGSSYFDARGVGLLSGRGFSDADAAAGAAVAVVDEKFARRTWPDRSPVGLTVGVGDEPLRTIVGVVSHQRWNLSEETPGLVYLPRPPPSSRTGMLIWAPDLREEDVARRLAAPLTALAPHYDIRVRTETFDRRFADQLTEVRMQRPVVIVLGLFAFVLAGVGLFGLVTWLVEQRTRDFGIRLALGARAADIWSDVVRQSVVPAVSGMAIGAGIAWTLEGVVEATMYGWKPSGLLAMSLVSVALLTVAILAAIGPARRVLRIDPTMALRAE